MLLAGEMRTPEFVRRVPGVREDDLVAGIDQRQQALGQCVLGTHRDEHLVTCGGSAPPARLLRDRVAQLRQARPRHVPHVAVLDCLLARLVDVRRRAELISLEVALLEVDDPLARLALQRLGLAHGSPLPWQHEV